MNDLATNAKFKNAAAALDGFHAEKPAENTDIEGLAEFGRRAGLQHEHHQKHARVSLAQRIAMTRVQRRPNSNAGSAQNGIHHNEDSHLQHAAIEAVEELHRSGRTALEARLTAQYDPLERHTLLRKAWSQAPAEGGERQVLDDMLSTLMDKHGDEIRPALEHAAAFEVALDSMRGLSDADGGQDPGALHDLYALYGAKGKAKLDAPLAATTLAHALLKKFGNANFSEAMGGLRAKMAIKLRARRAAGMGADMWLSLADAASFNAVQTSFALGGELRAKLSDAGVMPYAHEAATGLALLGAAERDESTVDQFVAQIVNSDGVKTPHQATQMYRLLGQAVASLPTTLWPHDKLSQRAQFLGGLRERSGSAAEKTVAVETAAGKLEKYLRNRIAGSAAPAA